MGEPIHFDSDLYPRAALESAAQKFQRKARIEFGEAAGCLTAQLQPLGEDDEQELRDAFSTEAFSQTAQLCHDSKDSTVSLASGAASAAPSVWALLASLHSGSLLADDWTVASLDPIRGGAATLTLQHPRHGTARVSIRHHDGTPIGVASTAHLDFLLMNGGGGAAPTQSSLETALLDLTETLRNSGPPANEILDALRAPLPSNYRSRRVRVDLGGLDTEQGTIRIEITSAQVPPRSLYDAVLRFADRCYIFVSRSRPDGLTLRLRPRAWLPTTALETLAKEVGDSIRVALGANRINAEEKVSTPEHKQAGLPNLPRPNLDLDALLTELEAADPQTLGIGFQPPRGPAHAGMGVLNILGTGACNSDCVFCCEKFHPHNRVMPSSDATRQLILRSSGSFDMLFFASGEPTIHPRLFEYVELAKRLGYTSFGMSSHFRTLADPRFALKTLEAGFQFFDISLHAADADMQIEVNPIGDDGASLWEALKGIAVLYRLADALGTRITITQKVVVSRLNVTRLEETIAATYARGVRHFILQPVRTVGLSAERQKLLAISEDDILPHLNDLIRKTANLGVTIKPYGFARQGLAAGDHIESEQNRLKNISGRSRQPRGDLTFPPIRETRPSDGRMWVELRAGTSDRFAFAAEPGSVVLDGAIQRGALLSFGCRMGSCGMCCAKIVDGKVDQSAQLFLTEEQVQQGYVLLCQARPLTDVTFRLCTDDEIDAL